MKTLTALFAMLALALTMGPATADERQYSEAELDQMLAPIALHPDGVLSNILIAATYPVEVVQAARWSRDNPGLEGEAALAAVEDRDWDPSVKALVAFPEILARLDEDIDWTQKVGDAFMFQEAMVMDSIQGLRDRAYAHGSLKSNEHVRVVRERETIAIEPVRREVVYVPYYDPRVVYGPWAYSAHPPVYWTSYPPGYYSRASVGLYWGRPVYVTPAFYYSSFYWPQRHIVVVNVNRQQPQRWRHAPRHRPPVHQTPRRHQHRQWANERRETFPRGLRGPSQPVRSGGHRPSRDVRTSRDAQSTQGRGAYPRGLRGPDTTTTGTTSAQRSGTQSRPQPSATTTQPRATYPRGIRGPQVQQTPAATQRTRQARPQTSAPRQQRGTSSGTTRRAPAASAPAASAPSAAPAPAPARTAPAPRQRTRTQSSDSGSAPNSDRGTRVR